MIKKEKDMMNNRDFVGIDELMSWMSNCRATVVDRLDTALQNGLITQKERDVMYFRHIDWNSLENCGKKFGVTRERIRQIEAKVLEKIRQFDKANLAPSLT